jgi:hypothetical protein
VTDEELLDERVAELSSLIGVRGVVARAYLLQTKSGRNVREAAQLHADRTR